MGIYDASLTKAQNKVIISTLLLQWERALT